MSELAVIGGEIIDLAALSPDLFEFYGRVDDRTIDQAENSLQTKFPPSYRAFLQFLGGARMMGYTFNGLPDNSACGDDVPDYLDVVQVTQSYREELDFFSNNMISITDNGGSVLYCLDTGFINVAGESPVFALIYGNPIYISESFLEFVRLLATDLPRLYKMLNE